MDLPGDFSGRIEKLLEGVDERLSNRLTDKITKPSINDEIQLMSERVEICEMIKLKYREHFPAIVTRGHIFSSYYIVARTLAEVNLLLPRYVRLSLTLGQMATIFLGVALEGGDDRDEISQRGDSTSKPKATKTRLDTELLEYFCDKRRHIHDYQEYLPVQYMERLRIYQLSCLQQYEMLLPRDCLLHILHILYLEVKSHIALVRRQLRKRRKRFGVTIWKTTEPELYEWYRNHALVLDCSLDELVPLVVEEWRGDDSLPDPPATREELDLELEEIALSMHTKKR